MKKLYNLFVFIILSGSLFAQTEGMVSGTVTDADSNGPLPGATVRIKGTYTGATTDLSGSYSFFSASGEVTLEFSFVGYAKQTVKVNIAEGSVEVVNVQLASDIQALSEVIVVGALKGQMKALNQQRASDNIKNIVSADQLGRFPDQNAAETLQRVPGINVQRDQGDGRFVQIRGLAPQFTNISINGEQIPSPDGDVRFVALDAIPADQLASLEVTKAITPDMDGDAIGGSVNLITRTAQSEQIRVTGAANLQYSQSSNATVPQGSLTVGQRLAGGKFGYIINGSFSGSDRDTEREDVDRWDNDNPDGLDEITARYYEIVRNRIGASATFDYKINDKSKIYLRSLYSELRELELRRTLEFSSEDDGGLEFETTRDLKYRPENQGVYSINLGGSNLMPKLKLDYEVSYSKAFQETPSDERFNFENAEDVSWNVDLSNRSSPNITNFTFDGAPADFRESSLYEFNNFQNSETLAEDENITAKINFNMPIISNKGSIKFGGKVRFKDKSFDVKSFEEYNYTGGEDLLLNSNGFSDGTDFSILGGDFNSSLGAFPDRNGFMNFFNSNRGDFENDSQLTAEETILQEFEASEDVYAGYVQGKIQLNKLMILGGLRYEATQFRYKSGQWDADNEVANIIEGENDYAFLLPMLHFKYSVSPLTIIRAAATMSYSRPNFVDLVQGSTFDVQDNSAEISNPNLVPVNALNLDLFGEHYFGTVGLLSGGVFYKRLDNFIYQQTTDRDFRGTPNVEVTQSINGGQANIFGFELAYQQTLSFLPGILSGLGLYVNYTYTTSTAEVENFTQGDFNEINLPGQADHIGNVAIAYNKGGFNGRIALNFNGAFISEFDGDDIIIIDARKQIDISLSQSLYKRRLTVFLELVNITDDRQIELFNSALTPKQQERYGFWGRTGIKFDLSR